MPSRETTVPTDTLLHTVGAPAAFTGMVKSAFRPSDDALRLPFNVAANAFAVVELRRNAQIFSEVVGGEDMAHKLEALANEIESASV